MTMLENRGIVVALAGGCLGIILLVILTSSPTIEDVTGKTISTADVELCFLSSSAPAFEYIFPTTLDIVNGSITLDTNVTRLSGITSATTSFSYTYEGTETFVGNNSYDGDAVFSFPLNTGSLAEGNCNYTFHYVGTSSETACFQFDNQAKGRVTVDNTFVEPTWDNYRNAYTTNFTLFSRWSNISSVNVGTNGANVSFERTTNMDEVDFDRYLVFGEASVNITLKQQCFSAPNLSLTLTEIYMDSPLILRNGSICSVCANTNFSGTTLSFNAYALGNYTVIESAGNVTTSLNISDDTDPPRNRSKFALNQTRFYANYSRFHFSVNGTGAYCTFQTNESGATPTNMTFNATSKLYEHSRSYSKRGIYDWNVSCNGDLLGYIAAELADTVRIDNTPPQVLDDIPDVAMDQGSLVTGLDLNEYFTEIEGDTINFSHTGAANIIIVIDSDGIVSFIPESSFFGVRTVQFTANDSLNTTFSNVVTIVVQESNPSSPSEGSEGSGSGSSSGGGGGGGGGGARNFICVPDWYCTPFGICVDGVMNRSCYDLKGCNSNFNQPDEQDACVYIAHCNDGVQNEGETGIDCGGECQACATCYDRWQNQDETDIDCGGVCPACADGKECGSDTDCVSGYCNPLGICSVPSCEDGYQNQGENGIDCGGPCSACPTLEQARDLSSGGLSVVQISLFLIIGALSGVLLMNVFGFSFQSTLYELLAFIGKKNPFVVRRVYDVASLSPVAQQRVHQISQVFQKQPPQHTYIQLYVITRWMVQHSYGLSSSFSTTEVEKQMLKSKGNLKRLGEFYLQIQRYRNSPLTKKDLQVLLIRAHRLFVLLGK